MDIEHPDSFTRLKTFSTRRIRTGVIHPHIIADPFLLVENDQLYLFAEIQNINERGYIHSWSSGNGADWKDLGPVLKTHTHHSYPFVFKEGLEIYMIPESGDQHEVHLYRFNSFPGKVEKVATLLSGNSYRDSNVIKINNIYYLFTSDSENRQLLFYSDNLLNGLWVAHPCSPISTDMSNSRNGGGAIFWNNQYYRIAQDCATEYGGKIRIMRITTLSQTTYSEQELPVTKGNTPYTLFKGASHHLSLASFKGKTILAIDGKETDLLINRAINFIFKKFR